MLRLSVVFNPSHQTSAHKTHVLYQKWVELVFHVSSNSYLRKHFIGLSLYYLLKVEIEDFTDLPTVTHSVWDSSKRPIQNQASESENCSNFHQLYICYHFQISLKCPIRGWQVWDFIKGPELLCLSWHHHQKALKLMIETDGVRCGKLMMTMLYFPRKTSFIKQSSNCALVCQKLVVALAPPPQQCCMLCDIISSLEPQRWPCPSNSTMTR